MIVPRPPEPEDLAVVNRRLRALIDVGLELGFERDPERLLRRACAAARDLLGASYVTLGILAPDGRTVRLALVCGPDGTCGSRESHWIKSGQVVEGLLESIVHSRRAIRGLNTGGAAATLQLPALHPEVQAYLGVPIASGHDVYGWICAVNNDGIAFVDEDEQLLSSLAGKIGRVYELDHEIAERKETDVALRQERDRAQRYLDAADVMLLALDLDGRITLINRKGCELLERTERELLGHDWVQTCLPVRTWDAIRQVIVNVRAGDFSTIENPILTPSGTERIIEWRNTLLRDAAGNVTGTFSSGADVTERRILEAQYLQAQKMEAIGRLAGGVAHDFNNLLTVILGYCEVLCVDMDRRDPRLQDIKEIQKAGISAAGLTRQLLAFSRKEMIQPVLLDLNELVADMRAMLQRVIGEDIDVVVGLLAAPTFVMADRGQVEQVMMNLVVNARDAMPRGGTVTISTALTEVDPVFATTHGNVAPGPFAVLAIGDTGAGMTAAVQARVFEPFFTTKELGRGTGLGLPTVQAIVTRSGGTLHIDTQVGRGTTVSVYLPQAAGTDVALPPVRISPSHRVEHAKVLIVEDAEEVLDLASKLLRRQGHTVLAARNGDAALEIFDNTPDIDVVLTDVVMPGWSGPELIKQLQGRRRGLRAVYMSGYTEDAVVNRGELEPGVVFLHKPFTSESLAAKLREALDRAAVS